jgi:hypothetical protein
MDVALNTNLHSTLYNWDFDCILGRVGWDLALKASLAQYCSIGNLDWTRQGGQQMQNWHRTIGFKL